MPKLVLVTVALLTEPTEQPTSVCAQEVIVLALVDRNVAVVNISPVGKVVISGAAVDETIGTIADEEASMAA